MPTYEYLCAQCGHAFELFQGFSEAVKRKCPSCGRLRLRRLIGAGAGIIFKGSGFYETDYRSPAYNEAAKKESETAAGKKGCEQGPCASGAGGKEAGKGKKAGGPSKKGPEE